MSARTGSATASVRTAHRIVGIAVAAFLVSSAVTGLLWAYAPFLYWQGGYLERKTPAASPSLDAVTVTVQEAIQTARTTVSGDASLAAVVLRADAGRLLYEVQYRVHGIPGSVLVDATTGERLSPLGEHLAVAIARQYVRGTPAVKEVARLDNYVPRGVGAPMPVYRISFDQPGDPEVFIHRDSGQIVEEQDRVRRFHFFVMKLHQLNFFGFKKTLTVVPGVTLLVMVGSGVVLWLVPKLRQARWRRKAATCDVIRARHA